MALILNEEQQSLKDIASEFLQSNAPVTHFREIRDTQNELGYDESLWMEMVNLGWSGILIPEEYGGFDFGMVGMGSILEEAGKTLTPSPLFSTGVLGASLLTLGGNDSQKQTYLPQIVDGTLTTALALEESNRHSPYSIDTQAKKNGDQFIISGSKNFVIDGHSSNLLIVAARTEGSVNDESGITLFLVNSDNQGVEITKTSMVDSRNAANIKFSDVTVSSDNILGEENNGASLLEVVLDRAQIAISAEMLGNASQAFNLTLEYLKERKQFGAVIGTFQALQHRAAEMYSELELTKSSVIAACNAVDENSNDLRRMASLAKFKSGETNHLITNEAVQMHGGVGVTDEYDVGLFMKRARVTEQIFGNSEYHIDRYATLSDY
ncbi:MAG: acyl-CoA/acyl-ACP dehydrogenase [SAR86 cluster bacterium]|nr:acyl-CoA/acyl-ACP dehydrogenase [SAR86 cluster bacterium]